jgi:hypothetical protein
MFSTIIREHPTKSTKIIMIMDPMQFLQMSFFSNMMISSNANSANSANSHIMQMIWTGLLLYFLRMAESPYYRFILLEYIKNYMHSGECAITIPTHKRICRRSFNLIPQVVYSTRFRAINHYLLNHTIKELPELCELLNVETDEHWNETEREFILIPVKQGKLRISTEPEIYFENSVVHEEGNGNGNDDSSQNGNKVKQIPIHNRVYRLSMNGTHNMQVLQKFMDDCEKAYEDSKQSNQQMVFEYVESVQSGDDYNKKPDMVFQSFPFRSNKMLDRNIFFENRLAFLEKIRQFPKITSDKNQNSNASDYEYLGIPCKCTILLDGEPGCGKTSVIKGILNETKRHGVIVQWSRLKTCRDLSELFRNLKINGKKYGLGEVCYIFEDFDANKVDILRKRKTDEKTMENAIPTNVEMINIHAKNSNEKKSITDMLKPLDDELTLDYVLNLFDGVIELYNAVIIFTTNMPLSTFDPALIRPGRIDLAMELKKCSVLTIREIFKYNYRWSEKETEKYKEYFEQMKDDVWTPCVIQNLILSNLTDPEKCLGELIRK